MIVGNTHQRDYPSHHDKRARLGIVTVFPSHMYLSSSHISVFVGKTHQKGYPSHHDQKSIRPSVTWPCVHSVVSDTSLCGISFHEGKGLGPDWGTDGRY